LTTTQRTPLSLAVANVVYVPTTMAYALFLVHYDWLALALYLIFMLGAKFRLGLFEHLDKWPTVSRIALYAGPPYLLAGFLFPAEVIRHWVALPITLYTGVAIAGGVALRRANIDGK
jgi:hypothetical protein